MTGRRPAISLPLCSRGFRAWALCRLLSWVAKWESQRKSERLKAKVVTKRNRAGAIGQRAGWGGGTKGSNGGVLASAEDIRRARALKAGGASVRAVGRELGLSKSQVQRILASTAYS